MTQPPRHWRSYGAEPLPPGKRKPVALSTQTQGGFAVQEIKIEEGKTLEHTADWLADAACTVLRDLFPDQWREGLALMAQQINRIVGEGRAGWPL
jgi:hypothetical protein